MTYVRRGVETITPEDAGWGYSGLRIVTLEPGGTYRGNTAHDEVVVLPLSGSVTVEAGDDGADLAGRRSVFDGVSDFAYVSLGTELTLTSPGGGRFALATARAGRTRPF